ncbi:hypothetical protein ACWDE0_01850 [Streptomyces sp. 900105755]
MPAAEPLAGPLDVPAAGPLDVPATGPLDGPRTGPLDAGFRCTDGTADRRPADLAAAAPAATGPATGAPRPRRGARGGVVPARCPEAATGPGAGAGRAAGAGPADDGACPRSRGPVGVCAAGTAADEGCAASAVRRCTDTSWAPLPAAVGSGAPRPGRGAPGVVAARCTGAGAEAGAAAVVLVVAVVAAVSLPTSPGGIGTAAGTAPPPAGRGASRTPSVAPALSLTVRCTGASRPPPGAGDPEGGALRGAAVAREAGGVAPTVGEAAVADTVLVAPVAAVPEDPGVGAEVASARPLSGDGGVCRVAGPVPVPPGAGAVWGLPGAGRTGGTGVWPPPLTACRCTGVRAPAPGMPEGLPSPWDVADAERAAGAEGGVGEGVAGAVRAVAPGDTGAEAVVPPPPPVDTLVGLAPDAGAVVLGRAVAGAAPDADRCTAAGAGARLGAAARGALPEEVRPSPRGRDQPPVTRTGSPPPPSTARCSTPSAPVSAPARSPSPDAGTAASVAVTRGADGNVRRCTAVTDGPAGAVVSALRRGGTGGAGATRGPVAGAGATGVGCGAHATGTALEAAADVTDRWTAGTARCPDPGALGADPLSWTVDGATGPGALFPSRAAPGVTPVRRAAAPPPCRPADATRCTAGATGPADPTAPADPMDPAGPADSRSVARRGSVVAGRVVPRAPDGALALPTARNGTTGTDARRPAVGPGCPAAPVGPANGSDCTGRSRPDTAPAPVVPIRPPPASRALDSPSRTACERVPMNDGFCQVGSRPPNPVSATGPPSPSARWIGGSPDQAAATTGRGTSAGASGALPFPFPAPPASDSRSRPRTRSHSPTCQPSAPAEAAALVTRDAISAV